MPDYTIDTDQLEPAEAAMVQALADLARAETDESVEQAHQDLGHAMLGAHHWECALRADMQAFYRELLASKHDYPGVCADLEDLWYRSSYRREWDWATDRLHEWTHNPDTARAAAVRARETGRWNPPQDGYTEELDDPLPDYRQAILDMALLIADPSVRQIDPDDTDEVVEPFDIWTRDDFIAGFAVDDVSYDGAVWSPDGDGGVMLLTDRIDQQLREKFVSADAIESQLSREQFAAAFRLPYFADVVEVRRCAHGGWTARLHHVLSGDDRGPWYGCDIVDHLDCLFPNWAYWSTRTDTVDSLIEQLAGGEPIGIAAGPGRDESAYTDRPRWNMPINVPPDVLAAMHRFDQRIRELREALGDARTLGRLEADRAVLEMELQHRAEQHPTRLQPGHRLADLIAERGRVLLDRLNKQIADKTTQRWFASNTDAGIDGV